MNHYAAVAWIDGMLLQAQHFQQSDRHHRHARMQLTKYLFPHGGGWLSLQWNLSRLAQHRLQLLQGVVVMPDGALYEFCANGLVMTEIQLPSAQKAKSLYVYLVLANNDQLLDQTLPSSFDENVNQLNPHNLYTDQSDINTSAQLNVSGVFTAQGVGEILSSQGLASAEYRDAIAKQWVVDDVVANGSHEIQLRYPLFNWQLSNQCLNSDQSHQRVLAVVLQSDGYHWQVHDSLVVPLYSLRVSSWLLRLVQQCHAALSSKAQVLSDRVSVQGQAIGHWNAKAAYTLYVLGVVAQSATQLDACLSSSLICVQTAFQILSETVVRLLVGRTSAQQWPRWNFQIDCLGTVFSQLHQQLFELLSYLDEADVVRFVFEPRSQSLYAVAFENLEDVAELDLYLLVQSKLPEPALVSSIPSKVKVGASDDVMRMVHSALPGVELVSVAGAPAGLSSMPTRYYFHLQTQSMVYQRMLQQSTVILFVPDDLKSLQFELLAVRRRDL